MSAFSINIKNFDKALAELKQAPKDIDRVINNEFKAFGQNVVTDAQRLCPVDDGFLRQNISSYTSNLQVNMVANAPYAVYVEFGIKSFAAKYVPTLPPEVQAYARQFKISPDGAKGGFMAQPYLFPAFEKNKIELIRALKQQLNAK